MVRATRLSQRGDRAAGAGRRVGAALVRLAPRSRLEEVDDGTGEGDFLVGGLDRRALVAGRGRDALLVAPLSEALCDWLLPDVNARGRGEIELLSRLH